MSGDLISREAMSNALNTIRVGKNETWYSFYQKVLDELCKLPSAERRGHWIFSPSDAIELMFAKPKCSECGFESADGGNYCPNCGARMDGEDE